MQPPSINASTILEAALQKARSEATMLTFALGLIEGMEARLEQAQAGLQIEQEKHQEANARLEAKEVEHKTLQQRYGALLARAALLEKRQGSQGDGEAAGVPESPQQPQEADSASQIPDPDLPL